MIERSRVRIPAGAAGDFLLQGQLSVLTLISVSCVTAVAHKRSRSFCQKCRWQVTAKHAHTLSMWLCMKWHGAWSYDVHRTCAETAAVSCHRCKYTTSVDIQKGALKLVTHVEPTYESSESAQESSKSAQESGKQRYISHHQSKTAATNTSGSQCHAFSALVAHNIAALRKWEQNGMTFVSSHHSSGAVWKSRWPSWAVRPNEPSGFRGRKELLNRVTTCP